MSKRVLVLFPGTTHPVSMGSQVRVNYLLRHLVMDGNWKVQCLTPYGLLRPERWGENWNLLEAIHIPAPGSATSAKASLGIPHVRQALSGGFLEAVWRDFRDNVRRLCSRFQQQPTIPACKIHSHVNEKESCTDNSESLVSARLKNHDKDHYIAALKELVRDNHYDVIIVSYVWLSSMLKDIFDLPNRPLLVCDTIDIQYIRESRLQSHRSSKMTFDFAAEKALELEWLNRYDLLVAITEVDRDELRSGLRGKKVCSLPIEASVPGNALLNEATWAVRTEKLHRFDLLFLGGPNEGNIYALERLFTDLLPGLLERRPDLTLAIGGSICEIPLVKRYAHHPSVTLCGYVKDTSLFYQEGRVLLAPIPAGGGVKVKVLEALAHGVPVVTTSVGIEGIPFTDGVQGYIADEDGELIDKTLLLLEEPELLKKASFSAQQYILDQLGPQKAYESFDKALEEILISRESS